MLPRRSAALLVPACLAGSLAARAEEAPSRPSVASLFDRAALSFADGRVTIRPQLRLDIDAGGFWDQPRYPGGEPPLYLDGKPPVAFNLRRAYAGFRGTLPEDLSWSFRWQLAPGVGKPFDLRENSHLYEAYGAWSGLGWATLRAGVIGPAHLIDYTMSSFELPLLERASIDVVAASLASGLSRVGLGGEARGERWFAAAYGTGGDTGVRNDGAQRGLAGRAVALLADQPGLTLAVGLNAAAQFNPGTRLSPDRIRLEDLPEVELSPLRLLNTGWMPAGGGQAVGPEAAGLLGPVYVQAEYQSVRIDSSGGTPDRRFWGYYALASVPLGGAPRRYNPRRGVFTRPSFEPFDPAAGQWGWTELAARWSYTSLDDGAVRGGRQALVEVALNHYPTRVMRLSLQYSNGAVRLDGPDRSFQALAARLAFDW